MLFSAITALLISVLPKHENPFLFSIGLFSSYFILTVFGIVGLIFSVRPLVLNNDLSRRHLYRLLDDEIEYKFIAYAEEGLKKMSDDKPVPDFFNELQKFIKQNYANAHNVTKTTESVNPKMKKKDLMELIQSSNKLKVVERIKVKDLKR
jgi:hypothetical protein